MSKVRLLAHLWTLPRWFAAPFAVCGVLLGTALVDEWSWLTAVAVGSGLGLLAWAHSMNTLLDWSWTKFDLGSPEARSKPKEYTSGSQVIARGIMPPSEVFINALGWLALSGVLAAVVSWQASPWVWLPWALAAACTFWYSWGKLHYMCELALGLGFGSFAVMLGVTAGDSFSLSLFGTAFLAGLPFALAFGFGLETHDQWTDAERDVPKGLKNLGALLWKSKASPIAFLSWLIVASYIAQLALVATNILPALSLISVFAVVVYSYCFAMLEGYNRKAGVGLGLLAATVYEALVVVGVYLS